jgi:hypothetical protein
MDSKRQPLLAGYEQNIELSEQPSLLADHKQNAGQQQILDMVVVDMPDFDQDGRRNNTRSRQELKVDVATKRDVSEAIEFLKAGRERYKRITYKRVFDGDMGAYCPPPPRGLLILSSITGIFSLLYGVLNAALALNDENTEENRTLLGSTSAVVFICFALTVSLYIRTRRLANGAKEEASRTMTLDANNESGFPLFEDGHISEIRRLAGSLGIQMSQRRDEIRVTDLIRQLSYAVQLPIEEAMAFLSGTSGRTGQHSQLRVFKRSSLFDPNLLRTVLDMGGITPPRQQRR